MTTSPPSLRATAILIAAFSFTAVFSFILGWALRSIKRTSTGVSEPAASYSSPTNETRRHDDMQPNLHADSAGPIRKQSIRDLARRKCELEVEFRNMQRKVDELSEIYKKYPGEDTDIAVEMLESYTSDRYLRNVAYYKMNEAWDLYDDAMKSSDPQHFKPELRPESHDPPEPF